MKSGCYKAPLAPWIERQVLDHGAGFVTDGGNTAQLEGWRWRGRNSWGHPLAAPVTHLPPPSGLSLQPEPLQQHRMPRPLRVEFPGALYHVTSRGERRSIWMMVTASNC
jgi:hypothetical protein